MLIKTIILFFAFTLFTACGLLAATDEVNTISYTTNPPKDTPKSYYALGFGDTLEEAKADALGVISSKISVEVASNFSNSVTATRQDDEEMILSDTKNEVLSKSKSIEYSDVKILKSDHSDDKWSVLVEVNRLLLTKNYKRKLDLVDKNLKSEWKIYETADLFEKLKISVTIKKYLKKTDEFFPLIYALNPTFDDTLYRDRYINYTKEIKKTEQNLIFKIEADKNSLSLASLIKSKLSSQNITFSDTNYNIHLKIRTKAKKKKYRSTNEKFAKLTFALRKTTIEITDKSGNIVSNCVYKTKEGSSKGFKDALARTTKYKKKIDSIGIIAFITGK